MPTLAKLMKSEIDRAVSRQIRAAGLGAALRKVARQTAQLEKRVAACEAAVTRASARTSGATARGRGKVDRRTLRFSAGTLKKVRSKLDVTQQEMAKLLGVSGNAVWQWEAGRARPRAKHIAAMRQLRTIGSREARRRLQK